MLSPALPSLHLHAVSILSASSAEGLWEWQAFFPLFVSSCSFVPLSAVLQRMWFTSTTRPTRWCVRMWNSRPSSRTFTCTGWGAWRLQVMYLARSAACQVTSDSKAVGTAHLELLESLSFGPKTRSFMGKTLDQVLLPSLRKLLIPFPQILTISLGNSCNLSLHGGLDLLCWGCKLVRGGAVFVLLAPPDRLW